MADLEETVPAVEPVETDELAELVSFTNADERRRPALERCLAEAHELIGAYVGEARVPGPIRLRALLEVAADLYHRQNAPNGIRNTQFAGPGSAGPVPVRISRDPLAPAYPLLSRWVIGL